MKNTLLALAILITGSVSSLADTLHVKATEYVLTKGKSEPSFIAQREPQSWSVTSTKEVSGRAKLNKAVGFHVEVSGRGRINIDLTDTSYATPRLAHAQDDMFTGQSSLSYNYMGDAGEACKIEVKVWITR